LLVEVLHSVHGLDKSDLAQAAYLKAEGAVYRVLDPVAMLKAKTANVRDIDQMGPPPRDDRAHLQLIVRCVPEFLRDVHQAAVTEPHREKESLAVITRAFKALQNPKIARTLQAEGIAPASLIPAELAESPLPRIRSAYTWQIRLLAGAEERMGFKAPSVATTRASPRQGPRIGM
jgi:hypothetical protein